MNAEIMDTWRRARTALATASGLVESDPDAAASRAYYAAFYAVTALFLIERRSFAKHAGIEVAVHRDLVRGGRWVAELGAAFSDLLLLRSVGDYGGMRHASPDDAREAIEKARRILAAVARDAGDRLDALDVES